MQVYIIDAVLLAIVAGFAIAGIVRGFIKSIASMVKYFAAFIVSIKLYKNVAVLFLKIPFIANMRTDIEMPGLDGTVTLFDKVKQIFAYLLESLQNGDNIDEVSKAVLNNYLADVLSDVFAFLSIFIVALLLISLIVYIIDRLCSLPIIRTANRVLGFVFGVINGTVWAYIASSVIVSFLLPILVSKFPDVFTMSMGETPVVQFFMNNNPIAILLKSIELFGVKTTADAAETAAFINLIK